MSRVIPKKDNSSAGFYFQSDKEVMKIIPLFLLILVCTFTACQKELQTTPAAGKQLKISFQNQVDSAAIQLGSTYKNKFGEDYTITMFKYYISNISLRDTTGTITNIAGVYHLVDESDSASKSFILDVPGSNYNQLSFLIGVDSTRNVSGTQTGDLDPLKGMFWTWNTGYVMAKLEGTSPQSTAPNNNVSIHVGGFKTGENTTRLVSPAFPTGTIIQLSSKSISEVVLAADANTWFSGAHGLRIADNPVCTNAGELAVKFADNYANMFKVAAINN